MRMTSTFKGDKTFRQPIIWVTTLFMVLFHAGAIAALFIWLLGFRNAEIFPVFEAFAISTTVLVAYSGCTRLQGASEAAATLAVPVGMLTVQYAIEIAQRALF